MSKPRPGSSSRRSGRRDNLPCQAPLQPDPCEAELQAAIAAARAGEGQQSSPLGRALHDPDLCAVGKLVAALTDTPLGYRNFRREHSPMDAPTSMLPPIF